MDSKLESSTSSSITSYTPPAVSSSTDTTSTLEISTSSSSASYTSPAVSSSTDTTSTVESSTLSSSAPYTSPVVSSSTDTASTLKSSTSSSITPYTPPAVSSSTDTTSTLESSTLSSSAPYTSPAVSSSTDTTSTYGLEWKNGLLGSRPVWTVEPSVELISEIAYHHLKLFDDEIARTTVEFQFQGALNRLYAVECPRGSYLMRISLPVYPHFKTSSEVATIALLQSHTSIPVPHLIASSSTSDNELKFEWILMERILGVPLAGVWDSLAWDAKVACVKEVAGITGQLFKLRYDSIGNLFNAKDLPVESERATRDDAAGSDTKVVDRIVSMEFFWDKHFESDVHRGPFASSKDWLEARFQLMEEDCIRVLESKDADNADIEDMKDAQQLLKRLRKQLPVFFPSHAADREEFALHHDDINHHNLILDSKGKLQALVDWECVSVMPLWKACQIPLFLQTREQIDTPYSKSDFSVSDDSEDRERTYLQGHFLEEMARLAPQWIEVYEKSRSKRDFDRALELCDGLFSQTVMTWLDQVEAGETEYRLQDV